MNWFKTAELEEAQHDWWYAGMHPARPLFKGNMMINPKNMVVPDVIIFSDKHISPDPSHKISIVFNKTL